MRLYIREWICPVCGTYHDRDENASKNLYRYGLDYLRSSREGTARIQACGECSDGGMVEIPVYESSFYESRKPTLL